MVTNHQVSTLAVDKVARQRSSVFEATNKGVGHSMPLMTADASVRMETLIDNAEASLRSNRFNPLFGWSDEPGTG